MSLSALQSFAGRLDAVVQGRLRPAEAAPSRLEAEYLLSEISALLDSEWAPAAPATVTVESVACDLARSMIANAPLEDCGRIAQAARQMAEILCQGGARHSVSPLA